MNNGPDPGRGAKPLLRQLQAPIFLTAAPAVSLARIRSIMQVLARPRVFSGLKRGLAGCESNAQS